MSKQKITITDKMYSVGYNKAKTFSLDYTSDSTKPIVSLFSDENKEMVLNFNDKKDKRTKQSKETNYCLYFPLAIAASHNIIPKANFTFNQSKESPTSFYLYFGFPYSISEQVKKYNPESTFSFNGRFEKIEAKFFPYKKLVLNGLDKKISVLQESTKEKIDISSSHLKEINIFNKSRVNLENLSCPELKELVCSNNDRVFLEMEHLYLPKINKVDLRNNKTVFFNFKDNNFTSLKLGEAIQSYQKQPFKYDWDNLCNKINKNCIFIVSPNTLINMEKILPETKIEGYIWPVHMIHINDLFPEQKSAKEIKFNLIQLFQAAFKKRQEKLIDLIDQTNKELNQTSKLKIQEQNKEKKR